jgi:hypothetical protein
MAASRGRIGVSLRGIALAMIVPVLAIAVLVGWSAGVEVGALAVVSQAVGFTQPRLVYLQPGIRLSDQPPKDWSHLVLRSIPRLASGDQGSLPDIAEKIATLFRTVIVADVQPVDQETKDFVLARIGVGMCVPDGAGQDMVVTQDRLDALGLRLSTVERIVLEAAEAELAEGRIIARTSTFALLRGPVTLAVGGKHRKVDLFYAFCVEHTTGRLRVAVWSMASGRGPHPPPTELVVLGGKPTFQCELDVQARRLLGTIPVSWSFAMRSLPPGRSLRVPPALGDLIVATARHPDPDLAKDLERVLGKTLSSVREYTKAGYETADPSVSRVSGK